MEADKVLKTESALALLKANEKLLKPAALWKWFLRITEIPRGSGHVEQIAAEIQEIAKKMGLESRKDKTGNVCVAIPATPGLEALPKIILQAHMDMVVAHDSAARPGFNGEKDGIIAEIRDDGFLHAKGTSLGADDGIGVATCLAIMENRSFKHGGIDCLFTVDEETTMDGASAVRPELMSKGVKYLINVDSEDDTQLCLGSAGGEDVTVTAKPARAATDAAKDAALCVSVSGLLGGHTGCEIDKYRANGLKLLCQLLHTAGSGRNLRISKLNGGEYNNAIPNNANATVVLARDKVDQFRKALTDLFEVYREDYSEIEDAKQMKLDVADAKELPATCLSVADSAKVMHFWILAPCQPLRMSPSIKGFVESSCAWSISHLDENGLEFKGLARTSRETSWNMLESNAAALAAIVDGKLELSGKFSGWLPNPNSTLAKLSVVARTNVSKVPPIVYSVHAGLECGIIMDSIPGLEAVSIGPLVEAPHTVDERVGLSSVELYYNWVCEIIRLLTEDGEKNLAH